MASQAINNVVNVAIDSVADFTAAGSGGQPGIDDTKLSNGWRCWVTAAPPAGIATRGLWLLDKLSTALVNNLTVCATFSGVGRYLYFGAGGTGGGGAVLFIVTADTAQPAFGTPFTLPVDSTSKVAAGEIVYLVGAGFIQILSVLSATSLSVVNLGSPGNVSTPILKGSPGTDGDSEFGQTAVPNEAALTALETAGMPEGYQVFVQSHKSRWELTITTVSVKANEVILSDDVTKKWMRILIPSPRWTYKTLWYVSNPSTGGTGNNENAGTFGAPLAELSEIWRRLKGMSYVVGQYDIRALSPVPNTDTCCPSGIVVQDGFTPDSPTGVLFSITGEPNVTPVVAPDGVVAATQSVPSTNSTASITAATDFTGLEGKVVVSLDGSFNPVLAAYVVSGAVGSALLSDWYDVAGGFRSPAAPLPGDVFIVGACLAYEAPPTRLTEDNLGISFNFLNYITRQSNVVINDANTDFYGCQFTKDPLDPSPGPFVGPMPQDDGKVLAYVCSYRSTPNRGQVRVLEGGRLRAEGTAFINVNVRVSENRSNLGCFNALVFGGYVGNPSPNAARIGGNIAVDDLSFGVNPGSGLGVFNPSATNPPVGTGSAGAGVILAREAKMTVANGAGSNTTMLWGVNALIGVHVKEGSSLMIGSGITPAITDAGGLNDIKIDGGDIIPTIVPGTGVPSAGVAPITKWTGAGQWSDVATYNRNALNLKNNTNIINVQNT